MSQHMEQHGFRLSDYGLAAGCLLLPLLLLSGLLGFGSGYDAGAAPGRSAPVVMAYNTEYALGADSRIVASGSDSSAMLPQIRVRYEQAGKLRYAVLLCDEHDEALQLDKCGSARLF